MLNSKRKHIIVQIKLTQILWLCFLHLIISLRLRIYFSFRFHISNYTRIHVIAVIIYPSKNSIKCYFTLYQWILPKCFTNSNWLTNIVGPMFSKNIFFIFSSRSRRKTSQITLYLVCSIMSCYCSLHTIVWHLMAPLNITDNIVFNNVSLKTPMYYNSDMVIMFYLYGYLIVIETFTVFLLNK